MPESALSQKISQDLLLGGQAEFEQNRGSSDGENNDNPMEVSGESGSSYSESDVVTGQLTIPYK